MNTPNGNALSFSNELKDKIVVIDFWSSCCINCIHVLAEMEYLEEKFKDFPEVVFVGCHSAKFKNEKDLFMLR
jgi:thiol-disulfide isomerase/thioredoxin